MIRIQYKKTRIF